MPSTIAAQIDHAKVDRLAAELADLRARGGRLFVLGVGGSAGNASHSVNDFRKLCGIEAYAPVDNVSELTARANDEGWDTIFTGYLDVSRADRDDALFVFSVGGGDAERNISTNIVKAVDVAKARGMKVFGVVGRDGGFTKKVGDEAYSGSVVKQGEMQGVVIATGADTFFGRTAKLVAGAGAISHAQRAMFEIGNFLIIVAVALALIMVAVQVYQDIVITDDWGLEDALGILQFVLVLLVASIPVAMPAVFSITMALGALALSKQKAIVSKLSAIEEMAGVDILCSDKTGTLTKNQLTLGDPILFSAKSAQDCILAAALASKIEDRDAIDTAVIAALTIKSSGMP